MPVAPEIVGDMGHEEIRTCPYDPSHRIISTRFTRHLIKCQKNHPNVEMTRCPFNASHMIPNEDYPTHLEQCPDKGWIECQMERNSIANSSYYVQSGDVSTPRPKIDNDTNAFSGENWDEEIRTTSISANRTVAAGFSDGYRRPMEQTADFKNQMLKSLDAAAGATNNQRRPLKDPRFFIGFGRGRKNVMNQSSSSAASSNMQPGERSISRIPITNQQQSYRAGNRLVEENKNVFLNRGEDDEDDDKKQDPMRRKRKLEKLLRQLQQLEEMKKSGTILNEDQNAKLSRKLEIRQELNAIKVEA